MSIKAKILASIVIVIVLLGVILMTVFWSAGRINTLVELKDQTDEISRDIFSLGLLTDEFLLNPSERPVEQWLELHGQTQVKLDEIDFYSPQSAQVADQLRSEMVLLRATFEKLVDVEFAPLTSVEEAGVHDQLVERLRGQLVSSVQNLIAKAFLIADLVEDRRLQIRHDTDRTVAALVILLGSVFIGYSVFASRSIFRSLNALQKGAQELAKGNLSHKIDVHSRDETTAVAEAFNSMVSSLKELYESLEARVKQRTLELEAEKKNALDLARSLEQFKLAVESASDHIVITDVVGTILYANKAVERITGFGKGEVIGKKAGSKELWGGLMDKKFYANLWKTIKEEKQSFKGELKNKRKDGSEYYVYSTISPVLSDAGEVEFFVGIERDITKDKEVDKAKTEFVSLASHQLRTPLTTINWYTELLMGEEVGKVNEDQKKYLQEVYTGSKRMVELVNSLLNVSRLDMGTFAVDPQPTDVVKLVGEVVKESEPKVFEKKQELIENYADDIPAVSLDKKLFRMIVQNLLSNALKYTPKEGKIKVMVNRQGELLRLVVADTGMGIPESVHDKVFTKLFRADNVREKDTTGTGLGLYIIKSIVDYVGGKIWFESAQNKGTKFFVDLPISGMAKKDGSKPLEDKN